MNTYRQINRGEIHTNIKSNTQMHLVEALPEKYFHESHLPGAINLPHDEVRKRAEKMFPNKDDLIVVYCANLSCKNSQIASQTFASLGYTNVAEYKEGKQEWIEAGFPIVSNIETV